MTATIPQTVYDRLENEWRQMRETGSQPKPQTIPEEVISARRPNSGVDGTPLFFSPPGRRNRRHPLDR